MKTKFYTLIAGLVLSGTSLFACHDSTACKMSIGGDFHFWEGLDIGVNGYFNRTNTLETPSGYDFLEIDYARSHSIAWNMGQYNFHIYKNYVNLVTGIGLESDSYALRNDVSLATDAKYVTGIAEPYRFTKNKLKSTWINAPLMLEFNTSNKNEDRSFHFAGGVTFGYNIFQNRLKQEFSVDGQDQKRKTKDDFNINPFRYSLSARVGYGQDRKSTRLNSRS